MARAPNSELLGSNDAAITLGSEPVESHVKLATTPLRTFTASYTRTAMSPATPGEPDRMFLKLRNIRGNQDACIFDVSVNVAGVAGQKSPVGSLTLFGLEHASKRSSTHGGSGLTKTIEITDAIDQHLPELAKAGDLVVTITPRGVLRPGDRITVDQISLFRLSGS
jgi:tyrosinase